MKEYPILFSTEMVRAILDGRKTQTRRVITRLNGKGKITELAFKAGRYIFRDKYALWNDVEKKYLLARCPYGQDVLWVRETLAAIDCPPSLCAAYLADGTRVIRDGKTVEWWKLSTQKVPSIFMPKWACRLWLEIVDIRVERVQEIRVQDIESEGLISEPTEVTKALKMWIDLWNKINAKRGYGWDANPWVWVVEFRRIEK